MCAALLTLASLAQVGEWLGKNGVEEGTFTVLPRLSQGAMGKIVRRNVDVGVFTNRCEGGTNLVAMEVMAAGVPVVLSDNTGHKDVVRRVCEGRREDDGCYVLRDQRDGGWGEEGWGESQVEEVVRTLERVYKERDAARRVGRVGQERVWSWEQEIDRMFSSL